MSTLTCQLNANSRERSSKALGRPGNRLNEQKSVARDNERDNHNRENKVPDSLVNFKASKTTIVWLCNVYHGW
jgi:hypothetical protein